MAAATLPTSDPRASHEPARGIPLRSAVYSGTIRHRRFGGRRREFRHAMTMIYVNLDEAGELLNGMLIRDRPGLLRLRRRDHLGSAEVSLGDAVRELVNRERGARPSGPITLLTQLRTFGLCFNPVSFFYCFDRGGERIEAIVAEVTNTPWGERHAYVISPGEKIDKALHVSPFMSMDQAYTFKASLPGETLSVHIEAHEDRELLFDATLSLRRRPLTRLALSRQSAAGLRTLVLIYAHAVLLRVRGVAVHPHPGRRG